MLAGCGGGSASDKFGDSTDGHSGNWTVLVYLNADNDLEPYGILNFNQMEKVGSSDRLKIVVQMDRSPHYDRTNGNWIGCRRYLVNKDSDNLIMNSTLLEDMGNVDMGNPNTLREFIQWGQQNFPAENYCLVIWNHGSGWRSSKSVAKQTVPRNISFDDTSGSSIKTTDLPFALAGTSRLDVIAMDASLMQMLEVAYEIRGTTRFIVGSEESPPGDGYPYDKWLAKLASNPRMNPRQLAKVIAEEYVKHYSSSGYYYPVTESVIDTSWVPEVAAAADEFAAAVLPFASSNASPLMTARQSAQAYAFDFYKDLIDYAGLVNQVIPDENVSLAFNRLKSAMSLAVIFERHTGTSVERSHGLSIYMPMPGDYVSSYETLSFTRDFPNWMRLIKAQTY